MFRICGCLLLGCFEEESQFVAAETSDIPHQSWQSCQNWHENHALSERNQHKVKIFSFQYQRFVATRWIVRLVRKTSAFVQTAATIGRPYRPIPSGHGKNQSQTEAVA